jgi:hypothetical protein
VSLFNSGIGLKILDPRILLVKSTILKNIQFYLAPLFNSGVSLKVFVDNIMMLLRPWLQNVVILALKKNVADRTTF